jgi:RND family efflux transporter MFP subunit
MKLDSVLRKIARACSLPVLLIATGFALAGCGHKSPHRESRELPSVKVTLAAVDLQRVPETVEVVGTVRPVTSATVAAKVMAAIEKVHVNVGDKIQAGQLLAELDQRDLQAEYERAKADFDRIQTLLAKEAVTRAEFDAVQARYRVAETALSYARIAAPFDGIVSSKMCDTGDMAAPGRPLFVLEQSNRFRLEAQVPDRHAATAKVGTTVHVIIDATHESCTGTIGEVVPVSDPASRSITVKIDLACEQPLQTGQFGRAHLVIGERVGIFVSRSAVHQRGQLAYVLAAEDGTARVRLVKPGRDLGDQVEILSGLEAGEQIITGADGAISDGQPILP